MAVGGSLKLEKTPEMKQFLAHVFTLYGKGGTHDMGATRQQIKDCTAHYLFDPIVEFTGSDWDAEQVGGNLVRYCELWELEPD